MTLVYIALFVLAVLVGILATQVRKLCVELERHRKRLHLLEGQGLVFNQWLQETPDLNDRVTAIEAVCQTRHE